MVCWVLLHIPLEGLLCFLGGFEGVVCVNCLIGVPASIPAGAGQCGSEQFPWRGSKQVSSLQEVGESALI